MAFKVTAKAVRNNYGKIIRMGYCEAQNLFRFAERIAYTSGTYGWNADVFQIDSNTAIVRGYRPFGNVDCNYSLLKKYDEKAKEIYLTEKTENAREKVEKLLQEYVDLVAYNFKYKNPVLPYEEAESLGESA